ncbi:hypothetical protein ACTHGU_05875 [Chitinophagaceae bacterium MMS25-I14]
MNTTENEVLFELFCFRATFPEGFVTDKLTADFVEFYLDPNHLYRGGGYSPDYIQGGVSTDAAISDINKLIVGMINFFNGVPVLHFEVNPEYYDQLLPEVFTRSGITITLYNYEDE